MANAMVALANLTLGSAASSVTFGSIPTGSTYRDLRLVISYAMTSNTDSVYLRVNGDSGSNYSVVYMAGNGSSASSGSSSPRGEIPNQWLVGGVTTSGGNLTTYDLLDYQATDKHKSFLIRANTAANEVGAMAARWASTSAISSIVLTTALASTFAAGSTFSLYGVVSA